MGTCRRNDATTAEVFVGGISMHEGRSARTHQGIGANASVRPHGDRHRLQRLLSLQISFAVQVSRLRHRYPVTRNRKPLLKDTRGLTRQAAHGGPRQSRCP
jgi:hypothetical protein